MVAIQEQQDRRLEKARYHLSIDPSQKMDNDVRQMTIKYTFVDDD
jgi:hypothetical protein